MLADAGISREDEHLDASCAHLVKEAPLAVEQVARVRDDDGEVACVEQLHDCPKVMAKEA